MLLKTAPGSIEAILELIKLILTIDNQCKHCKSGERIQLAEQDQNVPVVNHVTGVVIYDTSYTNAMDTWSNACRRRLEKYILITYYYT